jgi:DeoR/GlpR family transcriptional regulator of sugar metabolism
MSSTRLLYWVVSEVQKRGRVKVGELATLVGVSYQYFRYSIVRQLTATYEDIVLIKESGVEYLEYRPKVASSVKQG